MSLLIRYIVEGLGWELGKTAAKEAVDALREPSETDAQRRAREKAEAKARRDAERAAAKEAARRAKEARQREKEVDRELRDLKKRLG